MQYAGATKLDQPILKSLVLGLGRAGSAAAQLLHQLGHRVWIQDENQSESLARQAQRLQTLGIPVHLGQPFQLSPHPDQIIVSPGIRWDHPVLVQARQQGIPTLGEAELSWGSLQHLPWVGITGTNGKTTTTALVAALFEAAGQVAPACGNIGVALADIAVAVTQGSLQPDWVVAELSSYQLEASQSLGTGSIGLWTTLTPDHLERHHTLDNYAQIKARLLDRARHRVVNGDDPYLYTLRDRWPDTLWTSIQNPQAPVRIESGILWVDTQAIAEVQPFRDRIPGSHNLQNLLVATGAAVWAGLDLGCVQTVIDTFAGIPHRLERVRELAGIRFVNDSKATNYDAAWVGLSAVDPPVILIAGGQPKQGDDSAWLELIKAKVAQVLLIGAAADSFAARLEQIHYTDYQLAQTLDVAVKLAWEQGIRLTRASHGPDPVTPAVIPPVTVLFSPACASFDQYPNFECRGDHFRACCQQLDPSCPPT